MKGPRASASEPRNISPACSPSPNPTASGAPLLAPIKRSSSPSKIRASAKARQARSHGLDRRQATAHGFAHEMGDDLGIGLGRKFMALGLQLAAQLPEILDNAIMY